LQTNIRAWSDIDMDRAIHALDNGDPCLNEVARNYNISKATLKGHEYNKNKTEINILADQRL